MATSPRNSGGLDINSNYQPSLSHNGFYHSLSSSVTKGKGGKKNNNNEGGDDDYGGQNPHITTSISGGGQKERLSSVPWSSLRYFTEKNVSLLSGVSFAKVCFRSVAFATITLYVLNQNHLLPKPIGMLASRLLFWPTLPITASRRIGKWMTVVDNAVIMGGAPFGFMKYPDKLANQFRVSGVINMCEEYPGPEMSYKRLGIEHLRLPTVDHFEPSVDDLKKAVSFIQKHESRGGRVYVHCRAGHGRSAAAAYAWLLYKEPLADPIELNEKLFSLRNVRRSLHSQSNINAFRRFLQDGGMVSDESDSEDFIILPRKQTAETASYRPWNGSERSRTGHAYAKSKGTKRYTESEREGHAYPASSLGRVFSDEDSTEDEWAGDERSFDDDEYDYSEDEF